MMVVEVELSTTRDYSSPAEEAEQHTAPWALPPKLSAGANGHSEDMMGVAIYQKGDTQVATGPPFRSLLPVARPMEDEVQRRSMEKPECQEAGDLFQKQI